MKKQFLIFYVFLWIILVAIFWCSRIDEMLFSIIAFYVGLPLCLLMIGLFGVEKRTTWVHITFILLAISYMLCEYVTFSLANMLEFSKFNIPEIAMFIRALSILYIGLTIKKIFTKN